MNENKKKYMKCTRNQVRGNKLELDRRSFESVQTFKCPGSTANQCNIIENMEGILFTIEENISNNQ
jgi:hypothetical protein